MGKAVDNWSYGLAITSADEDGAAGSARWACRLARRSCKLREPSPGSAITKTRREEKGFDKTFVSRCFAGSSGDERLCDDGQNKILIWAPSGSSGWKLPVMTMRSTNQRSGCGKSNATRSTNTACNIYSAGECLF